MPRTFKYGAFGIASLILLISALAHAARPARVDVDEAEIYSGPSDTSTVIGSARRGAALAASNLPTEGFHKVRLPNGELGWMKADVLVFYDSRQEKQEVSDSQPAPRDDRQVEPEKLPTKSYGGRPPNLAVLRLRLFGTGALWDPSSIADSIGVGEFKFGVGGGGELHFVMTPRLSMLVRVEHLLKQVVAFDENSDPVQGYQFELSSTPAMFGLEFALTRGRPFALYAGAAVGLGLNTRFISQNRTQASPNETIYSTHNFTGIVKGGFTWYFFKSMHLALEAGYRHNQTSAISPSTTSTTGSSIFEDGQGGYITIPLNLSGPIAGIGVGIEF